MARKAKQFKETLTPLGTMTPKTAPKITGAGTVGRGLASAAKNAVAASKSPDRNTPIGRGVATPVKAGPKIQKVMPSAGPLKSTSSALPNPTGSPIPPPAKPTMGLPGKLTGAPTPKAPAAPKGQARGSF